MNIFRFLNNRCVSKRLDAFRNSIALRVQSDSSKLGITKAEIHATESLCGMAARFCRVFLAEQSPFSGVISKRASDVELGFQFQCIVEIHALIERSRNMPEVLRHLTEFENFGERFLSLAEIPQALAKQHFTKFDQAVSVWKDPRDLWFSQGLVLGAFLTRDHIKPSNILDNFQNRTWLYVETLNHRVASAKVFDQSMQSLGH